jgi:orotidine-5'-phosphate decarboxylase
MREEILIDKPIDEVVIQYAKMSGLDGVVCSPN